MAAVSDGPTWQTIATAAAGIVLSVAVGAGGYFLTQQSAHDQRQDMLLDTISAKMIDVSITLVKIQQSATDAKIAADKAAAVLEERDQRELAEYRHRADQARDEKPAGKK